MPQHTFILNGKPITVDVADDVRLLWVIRDVARAHRPEVRLRHQRLQGLHLPPQRQGVQPVLGARSRTSRPTDEVTTIEGLADTVAGDLHPMQEAWLEYDVAQCGYCQPGQIMAAVAKVQAGPRRGPRDHRRRPRRDPQRLPLRHLLPHPRGHQGGRARCERHVRPGAGDHQGNRGDPGRARPRLTGDFATPRRTARRTAHGGTYTRPRGQPKVPGAAVAETAA